VAEKRRLVVDTNVLVAALLHPGRTPSLALDAALGGACTVLVDARIEAEYRDVLGRKKFKSIDASARDALIEALLARAERIDAVPYEGELIDDDDRVFVEVCLSGRAHVLVTGNGKHFPRTLAFDVLSPAELLERLTVA
jgi:putative PIN family toxin of toxin-antitoxin system